MREEPTDSREILSDKDSRIRYNNKDYVEAGKVSEISNGQMKHVEINGKEIAIVNLDGRQSRRKHYQNKVIGDLYYFEAAVDIAKT